MEPLQVIVAIGSLIAVGISALAFNRNGKKEAIDASTKVTMLETRVANMQELMNAHSLSELAAMKQSLSDLKSRVEKLDGDVEKKIDQLSGKVDNLLGKLNEILLTITKNK
jgi:cell division protein ZapA (FtsZ GTPase activity inhibitor)